MCVLWLVFIVPLLAIFCLPFAVLIWGINAAVNFAGKKRGAGQLEKSSQAITVQVAMIALAVLFLFLGFLFVRYWTT